MTTLELSWFVSSLEVVKMSFGRKQISATEEDEKRPSASWNFIFECERSAFDSIHVSEKRITEIRHKFSSPDRAKFQIDSEIKLIPKPSTEQPRSAFESKPCANFGLTLPWHSTYIRGKLETFTFLRHSQREST